MVTKSIEVEHFYNLLDNSEINYSKIIIPEILSPQTWGFHPNIARLMKFGEKQISFNWDHVFSFQNMLYYENPIRKHSWFIRICPNILSKEIPSWFVQWWLKFGAELSILPTSLQTHFPLWVTLTLISLQLNPIFFQEKVLYTFLSKMKSLVSH